MDPMTDHAAKASSRGAAEGANTGSGHRRTVLWVYAHPDDRSLNGSLHRAGVDALLNAGHDVVVSDLYRMAWNPVLSMDDYGGVIDPPPQISRASQRAYDAGVLPTDVAAEQRKLLDADAVIFQFPLWWYSVPAILKGWIDRVFVKGFAYGIPDPENPRRTYRYGDGPLSGRRALVITTTGSPVAAVGPRGVNGQLDQVLFPLLHGTLWYVGMDPLPPLGIHSADRVSPEAHDRATGMVADTVRRLWEIEPIPYRRQNGGDYDDDLVLRDHVRRDESGLAVHTHP